MDDNDLDKLLIKQMRRRSVPPKKKQTKSKRKHVYRAYWLSSSFTRITIHNIVRDEVFFIGSHKPGIIKGIDYPPTPVFAVVGASSREAIPMEHDDFTKLVAAIIKVSNDPQINQKSRIAVEAIAQTPNLYTEFDFNTVSYEAVLQTCADRQYIVPQLNYENIAWMKYAFSQNIRLVKDRDMRVRQLILVGRDVHNYIPVIALIKPHFNFYHIIPLPDDGLNFLTSLKLLIYCRPHSDFAIASVDTFEKSVRTKLEMQEKYTYFDLNMPLKKIIDTLR